MAENINAPKGIASLEGLITTQADAEQTVDQLPTEQPVEDTSLVQDELAQTQEPVETEPTQPTTQLPEPVKSRPQDLVDTPVGDIERRIEKDPYVNTAKQALEKYSNDNRSKALLLSQIDADPDSALPLLAAGVLKSSDLQNHRNSRMIHESQQRLQALESSWIEAPEDNIFKAGGNVILQGLTGAANALLAIPDVVITHGSVMAQEPVTDTDKAYQTYLLGREKVRELYLAKDNEALPKSERAKAQADYEAMQPTVAKMYSDLKAQPDFERAEDKYLTSYYEDNANNFIGSVRDSISGIANHEATNDLANAISDSFGDNVDALYEAKNQLDQGNLLKATASAFAGIAGLAADTVEAMVRNPRAILDITAQSFGMMAAGGVVGKGTGALATLAGSTAKGASVASRFGQVFNYQSMFAADAYEQFEQEYGHLPDAQQALILNGVTSVAAILALGGDEYMLNSVKKLAMRPNQVKTTAIKDVLSGTAPSAGIATQAVTSRTVTGALTETLQEFSESLAVQYAGLQNLDKVDLQQATVEALMASGAGGLTGAVGDLGSGLRKVKQGQLVSRLEDAKSGYTVTRNEITDIPSAQTVISEAVRQMNDVDASLARDEEGNVLNTQSNATAVAGMYDTVLSNIAGLDSALAGIQAADTVSFRENIENAVRAGTPLNQVIADVVADLEPMTDANTVLQQMAANPEVEQTIRSRMADLSPEQRGQLGSDIGSLASTVSSIVNQVVTSANQLVSNYNLDELVAGERAQSQVDKVAQKAKVKEAKAKKKAGVEEAATKADVSETKAKSKMTVAETISAFDSRLAPTEAGVTQETTVDEEVETTPATESEVTQAIDENLEGETPDTPLNAPTVGASTAPYQAAHLATNKAEVPVSGKSGNLENFNGAMTRIYAGLRKGDNTHAKTFVGAINTLAKDLSGIATKTSLTNADKANAVALTNAIATYAKSYADLDNTNNAELGLLLGKQGVNFGTIRKALAANGVNIQDAPNLFTHIQRLANSGTTAKPKQDTRLDRPSASVTNTKRIGVHTTSSMKALKVPEVFSMLNNLVSNMLTGNVSDAPQELMDNVLSVLTASPSEFDTLYTALTGTNQAYLANRSARFTDVTTTATQEKASSDAYLALAEYFHRVDPEHRDLTYVLSKYMPEVRNALDTKLQDTEIPSEFSVEFNKAAKELVYVELPVNRDDLPKSTTGLTSMMDSGLSAIQRAGTDKVQEFIDFLVSEEGLSPQGKIVTDLTAYLHNPDGDNVLSVALVNPTMASRVNAFVNQNTLPNTVKEADIAVDAQWAGNVYFGTKEALERLKLGSDALSMFTTADTNAGGMYQVFNLFSVLEDESHENYERIVSSFTTQELAELKTVLPYIQSMRNMYSHMYANNEKLAPLMMNNKAIDLFESMATSSTGADNAMHPNLSAIIAQTALEYAMSDGIMQLGYNNQESIESLVPDTSLNQRADVRNAFSSGSTVAALAPRLGAQIVKRLGIVADPNAAIPADLSQLENSVGHMALLGLEKLGVIKPETVYFVRQNNNVTVHTQPDFKKVEAKVDGKDVYRMYSYNEETLTKLDATHENVFATLSLSKSALEKLYGKEVKANIATSPDEITVRGGDETKQNMAMAMAKRAPQYLHKGKLAVFNNLSSRLQERMFGGGIDVATVHEARKKSVEAKNRRALSDIGRITYQAGQLDQAGTNKFYLHQIVGGNTRFTGHNPKGIDPVGSSAARFLVNVEEQSDVVIGSTAASDIAVENMFYKGMLQALDMAKPEEISNERAKELFDTLETNADFTRAVDLVRQAKESALTEEASNELEALIDAIDGESIAHTLDAVWTYSNYLDAKTDGAFTFDATMFMEIDGKNNGSALGIMQNAPIAMLDDFTRMAKSVGLNFDVEGGVSFGEMKLTTEQFLDAYQHLAKAAGEVGNEIVDGNISEAEVEELLGSDYEELRNRSVAYATIMRFLAGKTGSLLVGDEVTGEGRNLFKQVLMTVLYGAGINTQDVYFANTIASKHLDTLESFARREDSTELQAEVREYFNNLRNLGLPTLMPLPITSKQGWQKSLLTETYAMSGKDIEKLISNVKNTIGITYRKALETPTYKNIITQANSAVESSNVAHLRLHFAVERLMSKYKEEKGIEGELTVAQNKEFESKYVKPLIGSLSYPISSVLEGNVKGVTTSSSTVARQHIPQSAYDAAQNAYEAELTKNPEFKGTRDQFLPEQYRNQIVQEFVAGTNTTLKSQILSRVLKSPAQSVAPSGVHAQDSSIQLYTSAANTTPFLNVFDAQGGTPRTMTELQGKANAAFDAITGNYNFYADLASTYSEVDAAMANQLTEAELADIDNEVANALGVPEFSYTDYMTDIKAAYNKIGERAKAVQSVLISTDQYPMMSDSFHLNGNRDEAASLQAIQEEYAESIDLDNFPSVLGYGLVNEGRNAALNAAKFVETETDVIRDVLNQGNNLYSTHASVVGSYVQNTISNFTSSLSDFAQMSNDVAGKKLRKVRDDVRAILNDKRMQGRLTLPKMDANNLDAEIMKFLQESDLPSETKQLLLDPQVSQLLKNASPESIEAGVPTNSTPLNLWLSVDNNMKWLDAPVSKLLSEEFYKTIQQSSVLGISMTPSDVIKELLLAPTSRSYLGKEVRGQANQLVSEHMLDYLSRLPSLEFFNLLMDSGVWGTGAKSKVTSVTGLNTALLFGIVQNPKGRSRDWFIPELTNLVADTVLSKTYFGGIASRIVNLHKKRGDFESGNLTPAIVKQSVLSRLMPEQTVTADEVPVNAAPESEFDVTYTGVNEMDVTYLGQTFPLRGDIKLEQQSDKLVVTWTGKDVDVSHVMEASGNQLTGVKVGTNKAEIKPVLGTPTFNANTNSSTYTEVNSDAVLNTYDAVVAQSAVKDSKQHADHLRGLVNAISSSLQEVKFRIADVTNKATSGYFMDNVVTVDINKLLPRTVTNFMSAGETIAHEYVHAVSSKIADISPKLNAKANELYAQAKRSITWKDLIDPNLHPDDAEVVAKRLYNYMFEDNAAKETTVTKTTGVAVTRIKSTRVAEFIALATTNENVARALDKIEPRKRQYTGFTAKVIQLFNAVLATFFRRVNSDMETASIHREMVDIIYTLAKLQNNHQSIVGSGLQSISDLTNKLLNSTDDAARTFLRRTTEWTLQQPVLGSTGSFTNPKSYLAAVASPLSLYGRWDEVKEKVRPQLDRISLFKSRTIRDLVTELSENTKDVNIIHDLISRRTQVIDAARQRTESEITRFIEKGVFSIPMSEQVSTALTHAVITTDFNKLVKVFGADKALDILHSDNKRLHSLRKQYQNKLKAFKNSNYYINHAKALGEAMVNGNSIYYGVHANAHSIARLAGDESFGKVETTHLEEITELVDVLASLYAVMNVHPSERMRARNYLLADNQNRKANNLDTADQKHVGLSTLLNIQETAAQTALEKNFYSNPQLMQKGYARETYNPNTEVTVVALDEVAEYQRQGFEVVGELPNGIDTTNKVMMVNHYSARLNYDQGAFSHTGFSQKGTRVTEDLLGSNASEQALVMTSAGKKTMDDARKSMFTSSPVTIGQRSVSIAPVRNDDGNIVGYRYTMSTQAKEAVLQRENRVSHVLARTTSSVEDKANSQVHNIAVLRELYKMYDEEYEANSDAFVTISPDSDNAEYREMWAMLPSYTRAMIEVMNAQRGKYGSYLIVPRKLLTLTFGSAPLTLDKLNEGANINTKLAVTGITRALNSKYGRMVSSAYKEALSGAKDTMVIKNISTTVGNIVSNFFALAIAGVPMAYTTRKTVQGWKEILQYQQLTQELSKLNSRLMNTPMSANEHKALKSHIEDIEGRISNLSITQLVDEGLYQTIVEDVDTEVGKQTYQSEMSALGDRLLGMTGKAEKALREGVFITHDSMTYRYLRDAAQLSDFVSRYVMFSHMVEEGKSVEEAVHESRETFILYDAPLSKPLKHLNDLGFFNFSKFLLRTQGVLHKNIRRSPARVLLYAPLWAMMGASATIDVLLTPFNFMELLSSRMQLNPLGFIRNGMTELPIIKMLN